MTKKQIVRQIAEELDLTQSATKQIVQRTLDKIVDALTHHGRIELRNFGVFEVKHRASRTARNPMTGQSVVVPERFVVTFKPGKVMEQRVEAIDPTDLPPDWYDCLDVPNRPPPPGNRLANEKLRPDLAGDPMTDQRLSGRWDTE